jgi:hypothetical protein
LASVCLLANARALSVASAFADGPSTAPIITPAGTLPVIAGQPGLRSMEEMVLR